MIPRDEPRKIRTGPSWCSVDLNTLRDQRVARVRIQLDAFGEKVAKYEREQVDEPMSLERLDGGGFRVTAVWMDEPAQGETRAACLADMLSRFEAEGIDPPLSAEMIGARLGLLQEYQKAHEGMRLELRDIANRPDRAPFHFRKGPSSRLQRAIEWSKKRPDPQSRASLLERAGALIGVTWANELYDLEAGFPAADPDALLSYSEAVQEELADHGLTDDEILTLSDSIITQLINPARRDAEEAEKLADFGGTVVPTDGTT